MGVTREDLKRTGRYLQMTDEEWAVELAGRQSVIKGYMDNDEWAVKIHKPVLILMIAHNSGRIYLKGALETHKKLGYWISVVYDNVIDPNNIENVDYNRDFIPKDMMMNIDNFIMGHYQTWGGVSYPFMWGLRLAAGFALNFKYVYCINGDCIIEKPEGFPKILEALGDADLMSSGPSLEREIGTAGLLMRTPAFFKIAQHMTDHVIPFSEYEKSTQEFGNTEGRLAVAVKDLGLKQVIVEPPYNEQFHKPGYGFWYKTIGFRHVHGELNYGYRYKGVPKLPFFKYLDERYLADADRNYLKLYEETKDPNVLKDWYAKE
jgi:hypothetical protein